MDATHLHLKAAGTDPGNPAALRAGKAATENGLMEKLIRVDSGSHWMLLRAVSFAALFVLCGSAELNEREGQRSAL